jgi:hypothetical protein
MVCPLPDGGGRSAIPYDFEPMVCPLPDGGGRSAIPYDFEPMGCPLPYVEDSPFFIGFVDSPCLLVHPLIEY